VYNDFLQRLQADYLLSFVRDLKLCRSGSASASSRGPARAPLSICMPTAPSSLTANKPFSMVPHTYNPKVTFKMPPTTSRLPRDDEFYVMQQFFKHVMRCTHCDRHCFTSSHRIYARSLCADGHTYGLDVRRYLYHHQGYAYSTWELSKYRSPVQVEVPTRFTCVRHLLHAVEYGLQLERPGGALLRQAVDLPHRQTSRIDSGIGNAFHTTSSGLFSQVLKSQRLRRG
jgi:hypothetical protein